MKLMVKNSSEFLTEILERVDLDAAKALQIGEYYMYFFELADFVRQFGWHREYNLSSHYFVVEWKVFLFT